MPDHRFAKATVLRVTEIDYKKLKQLAFEEMSTVTQVVRTIVHKYFENEKKTKKK